MTALSELTCLSLHRPGARAGNEEMSAWFDRLASVHNALATESRGKDAALERQRATVCRRRAQQLITHLGKELA